MKAEYLEEDDIQASPPPEWDGRDPDEVLPDIDEVIKRDKARFRAFCRKFGFKIPKPCTSTK